jgi:hypothetical protein
MKAFILFNLLVLPAFSRLCAQNRDSVAIKKYYEENTILWLGWTNYIKNNKSFPLKNLRKEIIFSPEAVHELSEYKRNRTYLTASTAVGIGLTFSALLVKDREVKLGMMAGGVVALTLSIPFSLRAGKHLSRAIWLHNRDILFH